MAQKILTVRYGGDDHERSARVAATGPVGGTVGGEAVVVGPGQQDKAGRRVHARMQARGHHDLGGVLDVVADDAGMPEALALRARKSQQLPIRLQLHFQFLSGISA